MYRIPLLLSLAILGRSVGANYDVKNTADGGKPQPELDSLVQVQILFRHGDRSPYDEVQFVGYPPFKELWPFGPGLLTTAGIEHEAELGKWMKAQYGPLIWDDYNSSNIYVRSSPKNRTIMSAQAFLTGLYDDPVSELDKYLAVIDTKVRGPENELLTTNCKKKIALYKEYLSSDTVQNLFRKHASVINLLKKVTNRSTMDAETVKSIADTLLCIKNDGFPLPGWCTDRIFKRIMQMQLCIWKVKYLSTDEILRIRSGLFFRRLIETFNMTAEDVSLGWPRRLPHLVVYSGHDSNVDQLRAALGVWDNKMPKYSSAVIMELHEPEKGKGINGGFRVKFRYKSGWRDDRGRYIQIPPCVNIPARAGCGLKKFFEILKPLSIEPDDYVRECENFGSFVRQSTALVTILTIASVLRSCL